MQSSKMLRLAMAMLLPATTGFWCAQSAVAAGFALMEQNSSGLGNAYAGAAATAEDASTIFFNSAGLTQLKQPSLVLNAAAVDIKSEFNNSGSRAALGQTLGGSGGNAGNLTVLPALYLALPLTDRLTGGLGVNAPFGLKTEYDSDWMGRFQAIKSDVKTINVNAALAFKVSDKVSVGIGADFQTIDATLTNAVNYTAAVAGASGGTVVVPGLQGTSEIKGDDSAWGYDIGVLFMPTERTRIGLAYRSSMKYTVSGDATFVAPTSSNTTAQGIINALSNSTNPAAPTNGPVTLGLKLPATARLAAVQKLGGAVELLGEVSWTQWSSIPELRVVRSSGGILKVTPENWDDTMRYALGANWQVNNGLKLRFGVALDEAPVPDSTRTPRLPDADRTWLSVGAKMDVSKKVSLDVGYTHVMAKDANLNQSDGYTAAQGYPNGLLLGHQQTDINILGVQATVSF